MKMKAAVFDRPGSPLVVRELDVPRPGPGQLLIRVARCGICGSDLHLSDTHSRWHPPAGTVMGHEFSGEVVDLGDGTQDGWKEGDRLTALPYIGCGHCDQCMTGESFHCPNALALPTGDLVGGYGEYAVVGAREAVRLSDDMSWEEGACNGDETLFVTIPTMKELNYRFVACYSIREFATAQAMIASGRIDPMPMFHGTVTLADFPQVFEHLRTDKSVCKLMLAP